MIKKWTKKQVSLKVKFFIIKDTINAYIKNLLNKNKCSNEFLSLVNNIATGIIIYTRICQKFSI